MQQLSCQTQLACLTANHDLLQFSEVSAFHPPSASLSPPPATRCRGGEHRPIRSKCILRRTASAASLKDAGLWLKPRLMKPDRQRTVKSPTQLLGIPGCNL